MYGWIWRHLPGRALGKSVSSLVLVAAIVALLWFVVFPWVTPMLPMSNVNVGGGQSQQTGQADRSS